METAPEAVFFDCANCEYQSEDNFKFCPNCGTKREERALEINPFKRKELRSLLSYFFLNIVLLAIYKSTENSFYGFLEDMVFMMIALAVIDVVFAIVNGRESFLFSFKEVAAKPMALLVSGLISFAFLVNYVADFLNRNLFDGYAFDGFVEGYPLLMVVGFYAVYPAVFEELAFRGFLINNLRSLSNDKTAILVSGFLFGIMHLSFVSLIWLIPIGMLFGYLRIRYNTLWYGIIGHFVYNLIIVFIERGVFDF